MKDLVTKDFVNEFADMEFLYEDLCNYWSPDPPPAESFFGDVVGPYLVQIALKEDPDQLSEFFQFLEDQEIDESLLNIGIIEVLEDLEDVYRASEPYIGSKLKDRLNEAGLD
jgi:hypothetical protein